MLKILACLYWSLLPTKVALGVVSIPNVLVSRLSLFETRVLEYDFGTESMTLNVL